MLWHLVPYTEHVTFVYVAGALVVYGRVELILV